MIDPRNAQWERYLQRWSLDALKALTLEQYGQPNSSDTLSHWLLNETADLGDFKEGPLSMGIRPHAHAVAKPGNSYNTYDDNYVWLNILGASATEAFQTLKQGMLEAAEAGRTGKLERLDALIKHPGALMRKIAFLYQDRSSPCLLPIYSEPLLCAAAGTDSHRPVSALHQSLLANRGNTTFWEYFDDVEKRARSQRESAAAANQTIAHFAKDKRLAKALKTAEERQLFHRFATALHQQGLDWWCVNLDQGWSIRCGRKERDGGTAVLLCVEPRINKGLQIDLGKLGGTAEFNEELVKQIEEGQWNFDFLALYFPNRDGLWPDDYGIDDDGLPVSTNRVQDTNVMNAALPPLNQILYGPPGTGKTYTTIETALEILDPLYLQGHRTNRTALKDRFDQLAQQDRIRFVTFHQSFSYEDFVEGLRALPPNSEDNPTATLSYDVAKGVFVQLCLDAASDPVVDERLGLKKHPKIWKVSIEGAASEGKTRRYCFEHGEARIGWRNVGDIRQANLMDPALKLGSNDQSSLSSFGGDIEEGDILVCLGTRKSICAVGVVTGEYEYQPDVPEGVRSDYVHRLPVKWLLTDIDFDVTPINGGRALTLKTVYPLSRISWPELQQALQQAGYSITGEAPAPHAGKLPHVLIIDEINRGNISRIFGELITLIEESKRAGSPEALEVILPYSKKPFTVPNNVYLIGTMNTADRSLAGLDIALRRRFVFREMPPRTDLLKGVKVEELDIGQLLLVINQRIAVLLDRDHCLGHAYFMEMKGDSSKRTLGHLATIFQQRILPLLEEYFFEDWERIGWVLNDHNATTAGTQPFLRRVGNGASLAALFGEKLAEELSDRRWELNTAALTELASYRNILGMPAPVQDEASKA